MSVIFSPRSKLSAENTLDAENVPMQKSALVKTGASSTKKNLKLNSPEHNFGRDAATTEQTSNISKSSVLLDGLFDGFPPSFFSSADVYFTPENFLILLC